ncbi:hypothetical protein, partial [Xanthomonas chitinilytica]|uniref:hypothetical protein n=1 Tax=Xanthomonas chitinilytica TaxID=2989819 RepID=UPI00223681C9
QRGEHRGIRAPMRPWEAARCGETWARGDAFILPARRCDVGADMFAHTAHVESIAVFERR